MEESTFLTTPLSLNIQKPTTPFNHYGMIESKLLYKTSIFLRDKYEHIIAEESSSLNDDILMYLADNIKAYNCSNKESVYDYIITNITTLVLPISTIQANGRKHCVTITYIDGYKIMSECYYYNHNYEIFFIQTYYDSIPAENMIIDFNEALKSVKLLSIAMEFLQADIYLDYDTQYRLLADDAYCFSAKGKENVSKMQKENTLTTGNTYSVPYPIICDSNNSCVTLDFNAYPADEPNCIKKGTDIMYIDLIQNKIQRIDTLRHTLSQPQWVLNHFTK